MAGGGLMAVSGRRSARTLWGFADQALSSVTNVGLTIVIAREAGAVELGAFGVAYAVHLILVGLSRALCSEPLLVRLPEAARPAAGAGIRDSTGLALVNGIAGGLVVLVAGLLIGGRVGPVLIALAAFLPALLLKDAWRFVFIAAGRPARAIGNDAVWALGQVAAVGWLVMTGGQGAAVGLTATWFVLAWGAAATVAAGFGAVQARTVPAPLGSARWMRDHRDLLPGYVVDFAARMGGRQLAFLTVGLLGGLTALGAIRAAEVLFGALNVVLQAAPLVTVPQAVAARRRSVRALRAAVHRLTAGLVAVSAGYGLLILLLPDGIGRALVGDSWSMAQPVLIAECALFVSIAAITGPAVGLRALGDARRGATVRLMVVPLSLAGGMSGAWLAGAPGAVYGLSLANLIGLVLWFRQLRRAAHRIESPTSPTSTSPPPAAEAERVRSVPSLIDQN